MASLRSVEPRATCSCQDSIADALATPTTVPRMRVRLTNPPATPERLAGAALIVAWLFGAMNNPSPTPKATRPRAPIQRLATGCITIAVTASRATKHIAIPATLRRRVPIRSASAPANGATIPMLIGMIASLSPAAMALSS